MSLNVGTKTDMSKLSLTPKPKSLRKRKSCQQDQNEQLQVHSIERVDDILPTIKNNVPNTRILRSSTGKITANNNVSSGILKVEEPNAATSASPINMRKGRIPKKPINKKKKTPNNKQCINNFFQSCTKTYSVEKNAQTQLETKRKKITAKTVPAKTKKCELNEATDEKPVNNNNNISTRSGRKRLFMEKSDINQSTSTPIGSKSKKKTLAETLDLNKNDCNDTSIEVINLCDLTDTEEEQAKMENVHLTTTKVKKISDLKVRLSNSPISMKHSKILTSSDVEPMFCTIEHEKQTPSCEDIEIIDDDDEKPLAETKGFKTPKACPPYKVIEGTTFAVDAFCYGQIKNVTHYFLTHFHADHYTGLTKKFSMPLYLSPLTARLVRHFIGVSDEFLHEVELNKPVMVKNIEITAIEAHHCPGAVMFVFKFPDGKCILHTGDFRACSDMESEPIFWNNDIDTIYLDTTYLPSQYAFCTQYESIDRAKNIIREFNKRHFSKRILYVCGSYIIGKEKFWSALAQEFRLKVWCEESRHKAITAMQLPELQQLKWVQNDQDADLHIIPIAKTSYPVLLEYFHSFHGRYDVMLAFRPSGWEKNSRPRYNGLINVVGIEYSEHSSFNELERFVKYLKPRQVISTVPVGRNAFETAVVPVRWYKYDKLTGRSKNFQPGISSYLMPMKTGAKVNQTVLPRANFAQDDQENSQKVSPGQSTPIRRVGGSVGKHNDLANACNNNWIH